MADQVAAGGKLKLYVDLGSQPARAVAIFCRANNISAEEVTIDIREGGTKTPAYRKINPRGLVPCIDDDGFKLYESHAILRYLATTRNVANHWYPKDPKKRALVDSALDWHHLNLRKNASGLVINRVIAKFPSMMEAGIFPNGASEDAAAEAAKSLTQVLDQLETMLMQPGKFLENAEEVSIADLSLVCELMQLQVLDIKERKDVLGCRERIRTWMENVKDATNPYFEDVHAMLYGLSKDLQDARDAEAGQ